MQSIGSDAEQSVKVGASDWLVCDYSATIQNFFNFDVKVGKRIEIDGITLFSMLVQILNEKRRAKDSTGAGTQFPITCSSWFALLSRT